MTKQTTPTLYKKYHVGRAYEISSLFEKLTERYKIQSVLYPGCYVHITPSFFIPRGVYVDTEMKAEEFFDDPNFLKYIESRKTYDGKPEITFYHQSYEKPIDEPEGSSDLLVSKYAGFVSKGTKKYLKTGSRWQIIEVVRSYFQRKSLVDISYQRRKRTLPLKISKSLVEVWVIQKLRPTIFLRRSRAGASQDLSLSTLSHSYAIAEATVIYLRGRDSAEVHEADRANGWPPPG
jgi:hypothetical protein